MGFFQNLFGQKNEIVPFPENQSDAVKLEWFKNAQLWDKVDDQTTGQTSRESLHKISSISGGADSLVCLASGLTSSQELPSRKIPRPSCLITSGGIIYMYATGLTGDM